MVEYKVLRVSDTGGSIAVVVQVPSVNKIVPICFNPTAFNAMSEEEIEHSVAEHVAQMFEKPQMGIAESKLSKMQKRFGCDQEEKPLRDTNQR